MAQTPLSRRERKRIANREAIRASALRLFMDRGFNEVSIEEIAEDADVSPSTVYRNFATKEDLVLADLTERQLQLLDVIDARTGATTIGQLLMEAIMEWAPGPDQRRHLRSEIALVVTTPALLARMQHSVVDWEIPISTRLAQRCGRPETDLEIRQLAALYCATIRIVIREWAADNTGGDIVEYGTLALRALEHLPASSFAVIDDRPS